MKVERLLSGQQVVRDPSLSLAQATFPHWHLISCKTSLSNRPVSEMSGSSKKALKEVGNA